jgi:N-acylneuraminate cytidylyltransferase
MNHNYNIVALIPCRSGSKGIIDKNIKIYKGIPLMAHSINVALQSKYIKDVYVSTDSKKYQDIALHYGAKVTPTRPENISGDLSPDIDTFKFFLNYFEYKYDIIVHLRPTYPNRSVELLDDCIEKFINSYNNYDSLRTVIKIDKCPYKMYHIDNDDNNCHKLVPIIKEFNNLVEHYNQARQLFPTTYLHNGCIDIVKSKIIIEKNILSGTNIYPYIMEEYENNDIDTIDDFINSELKK